MLKGSCLVVALMASLSLVGCGGGGSNPASAPTIVSEEVTAAKNVITPIIANASQILDGVANASLRASSGNINTLNNSEISNSVMNALEAPQLLRAVLRASGANIEDGLRLGEKDGLWFGEKDGYFDYLEVASFSNGVYERTLYYVPYYYEEPTNGNEFPIATAAHYLIDGCNCVLDDTTLKSFSINSNAKISIEEFSSEGRTINLIKGTIDTDLSVTYDGGKEENIAESDSFIDHDGNKITISENGSYWGFKATKKLTTKYTYTLNKPIVLKVNNSLGTSDKYNYIWNWNNGYSYEATELTIDEYSSNNINITISGITGTVTTAKTAYLGNYASYYDGQLHNMGDSYYLTVSEKPVDNLKYASTCEVTISGDLTDNQSYSKYSTNDDMPIENTRTRSATINSINVKLRNVSGTLDSIVVGDAEAHIDVGDYKSDEVLMIGNMQVAFNKAKIDVTGLKYDYRWKPTAEKEVLIQDSWWVTEPNEEYTRQFVEMKRKSFGNAKAHLEAEESKNSVTIKADCDINTKTATLNLVNNGNYIVKDKDSLLEFNFKTVDITATNVDVLANNKCEGAQLVVKGVEKDGTKSERTYNVKNGKLVLDKNSQNDKQAPASLPDVEIAEIPEGLADDSNSIEVAVSEADEDLEKSEAIPTKNNDGNETLKVVEKDGKKIAKFERKATKDSAKIESNITAKDNIICAVSFYGNQFTFVFVIDYTQKSPKIKGSIFKGIVNKKKMDDSDRFAQFAGEGGKITLVTADGSSEVSVQ